MPSLAGNDGTACNIVIFIAKRDLAEAKSDIVKWVAGLLLAQAAIIAALVKLLAN